MQQFAIRHHSFGKPHEVLQLEQIDQPEPLPGDVRVRLDLATINPSDYGMVAGNYGHLRELPAVAGREGLGVVDALGEGVRNVEIGTRVRFPEAEGAWQASACMPADQLLVVPSEVPVEQAAISFINPPTAYCLLKKIVDLQAGDWVLQNAGNSAVGLSVIQIAKTLGIQSISQVRREELIAPLKAMGADHVVLEGTDLAKGISKMTHGAPLRLALNSIGGESALDQIKALGAGGTQVTFGAMVGDKVRFPTRFLIFNDVVLQGFWWDQYAKRHGAEGVREVMAEVYAMMSDGRLKLPIEKTYAFSEYKTAIEHASQPRLGKILLQP